MMTVVKNRQVTVVGAGFTGLTAAYYLSRAGFKVKIVETNKGVGGLISTIPAAGGLVETAANGLLSNAEVESLFYEIGVPLQATKPEARRRYIYRDGRFHRWPLGIAASFRVLTFLARYLFKRSSLKPTESETISEWGARHLGEEATKYLLATALQGIYAGDPDQLGARNVLGRFFEKSKSQPGKIRGTIAPLNGMGELMRGLRSYLERRGVEFEFEKQFSFDGRPGNPVVLAVSKAEAFGLLAKTKNGKERQDELGQAEMLPLVTATLFFNFTHRETQGFGCLFPPVEKRRVLGVLKNDFIFSNRNSGKYNRKLHSETWIAGGAFAKDITKLSKPDLLKMIVEERKEVFGLNEEPETFEITVWPEALPHYTTEMKIAPELREMKENVMLAGNYLGPIGLSQILLRAKEIPGEVERNGQWI
ncbi:MAG: FAD-dependent oxidoreductase [Bdellovibrionota bacterium]